MEEVWKTEHSLEEFTDPKNFKTYTELKEKLDRVLGLTTTTTTPENQFPSTDTERAFAKDVPFDGGKPMTTEQASVSPPVTAESETTSNEYSYFAKLAEQD